jgi:hypothetical protein
MKKALRKFFERFFLGRIYFGFTDSRARDQRIADGMHAPFRKFLFDRED